ncbi:hypothetical protein CCP4SC76_5300002 [Gammaproteobacteria bacterium]
MASNLFTPVALGALTLANRVVMAPLTRCRADNPDAAPTPLMARYYALRASAGLIISEGAIVSPGARGYPYTPGIWSDAQVLRPALFKAYRPDLTPVRQETKSHAESGLNGPFINVGRWSRRMKVRARDVLDRILVENRRDSSDSFGRSVVLPRQQPGSTGIRQ